MDNARVIVENETTYDPHKERVRRFIALEKERKELENRLERIKKELADIGPKIITHFDNSGTQSERVDGMTVYVRHMLWARAKSPESRAALCEALKAEGYTDIVQETVNIHTLSAIARELYQDAVLQNKDENAIFPPSIMEHMALSVDSTLVAVASKSAGRG